MGIEKEQQKSYQERLTDHKNTIKNNLLVLLDCYCAIARKNQNEKACDAARETILFAFKAIDSYG